MSIRHWLLVLVVVSALISGPFVSAPVASAEAGCSFTLGFKALHDRIPAIVGACLEDEHFIIANGNAEQRTTGGLLVWRKVDNRTAFTDGATTWINGPDGVVSRPNAGPLFSWEAAPASQAALAPLPATPPGRAGFSMAEALLPAWNVLVELSQLGPFYSEWAPKSGVRVGVGALPEAAGGSFRPLDNSITINASLLAEDHRTVAPILAHELYHAIDTAFYPERLSDCLDEEASAFAYEARVWEAIWSGRGPSRTTREQFLNDLLRLYKAEGKDGLRAAIARSAEYQKQCRW